MTLLALRRRSDRELKDAVSSPAASDSDGDPLSDRERFTGRQDRIAKAMKWGLVAAIVCGPVALVMGSCGGGEPAPRAVVSSPIVNLDQQARAQDFAQQFVVTWLQAGRDDEKVLAGYVDTDALALPNEPAFVATDPRSAGFEELRTSGGQSGAVEQPLFLPTYVATVSVSVRPVKGDEVPVRRYYQVPVIFIGDNMRATNAPSPVAGPVKAPKVQLGYRDQVSLDSTLGASVSQFLTALLAGQGDLTRYTTPGMKIRAVSPAPYSSVELANLVTSEDLGDGLDAPAEGRTVRALVTANAIDGAGGAVTVQYPLTLKARAGRWEIAKIDRTAYVPGQTDAAAASAAATDGGGDSVPAAGESGAVSSPAAPTTGQLFSPPSVAAVPSR